MEEEDYLAGLWAKELGHGLFDEEDGGAEAAERPPPVRGMRLGEYSRGDVVFTFGRGGDAKPVEVSIPFTGDGNAARPPSPIPLSPLLLSYSDDSKTISTTELPNSSFLHFLWPVLDVPSSPVLDCGLTTLALQSIAGKVWKGSLLASCVLAGCRLQAADTHGSVRPSKHPNLSVSILPLLTLPPTLGTALTLPCRNSPADQSPGENFATAVSMAGISLPHTLHPLCSRCIDSIFFRTIQVRYSFASLLPAPYRRRIIRPCCPRAHGRKSARALRGDPLKHPGALFNPRWRSTYDGTLHAL